MKSLVSFLVFGVVNGILPVALGDTSTDTASAWRSTITSTFVPSEGCFEVRAPDTVWKKVTCPSTTITNPIGVPPSLASVSSLQPASESSSIMSVGGGTTGTVVGVLYPTDNLYHVYTSFLLQGYWSASLQGSAFSSGAFNPGEFSLQMNTNTFSTNACNDSTNPDCAGWQQFVYSSGLNAVYIEYWILHHGAPCPAGSGGTDQWRLYGDNCWKNSSIVYPPVTPMFTSLGMWNTEYYNLDCIYLTYQENSDPATAATAGMCTPTVLGLGKQWKFAEYNVFGVNDSATAVFNMGSGLVVGMTPISLGADQSVRPVMCEPGHSITAEWNNLSLVGDCCWDPNIDSFWFYESYYGPSRPPCPLNALGQKCGSNSNCLSGSCMSGVCNNPYVAPATPPVGLVFLAFGLLGIGIWTASKGHDRIASGEVATLVAPGKAKKNLEITGTITRPYRVTRKDLPKEAKI